MRQSAPAAALSSAMLVALLASPALAQEASAPGCPAADKNSTAPCFAGVSDILGGQRHLLANDDLLLSFFDLESGGSSAFKSLPFYTDALKPDPQSEQVIDTTQCKSTPPGPARSNVRLGRIYNQKTDVVVTTIWTVPPGTDSCSQTFFVTQPDGTLLHTVGNAITPEPRLALLDADLDGFDDIFMINAANMTFHTPADVNDPSSDMPFVSRYPAGIGTLPADLTPRGEPVSGDFNADGAMDIAWLGAAAGGDVRVHFVSVCPAEGWEVLGKPCSQAFEIIPWTETIDTGQTWTATGGTYVGERFEDTYPRMGIAAGDFWGDPDAGTGRAADELVIIKLAPAADAGAYAYEFGSDLVWHRQTSLPSMFPQFPVGATDSYPVGSPPFVISGRLDWGDRNEQVVAAWSAFPWYGFVVLSFDDEKQFVVRGLQELDEKTNTRIRGVAIGRFDPPDIDVDPVVPLGPNPPPQPPELPLLELDFNQQIAVLFTEEAASDGSDKKTLLDIYTADAPFFQPARVESARTVFFDDSIPFQDDLPLAAPLQAGDLQGRSLRLGAPEKITIPHTQVVSVLGMPPMHVDFITPPEASDPEVYNVSVFPDVFNSGYSFTSSSNNTVSSKSTTSYTYGTKRTTKEGVTLGVPDVASISVDAKQSVKQKHKSTVEGTYKDNSGNSYTFNTSTVFDDLVAFSSARMNIYSYPVIGELICPAELGQDCAEDQKQPLHVQFSSIDNVKKYTSPVGAQVLEWYQPVNEPGNLFSYPGDLTQLQADQPQQQADLASNPTSRFQLLSSPKLWSTTDDNTQTIQWSTGSTDTNTVGSVSNHSFDHSISISGSVSVDGFGASGSAKFDYNRSSSIKTLNTATLKLDEFEGVSLDLELAKSTNPNARQDYAGATYIFGIQQPIGTFQDDVAQDPDVSLSAQGPLWVASVVNMTSTDPQSSNWISTGPYTAAPDVALNHPQRWSQLLPAGAETEKVWFNCPVGYTSSPDEPDCREATPLADLPKAIADAPFYQMKGLFVTPGNDSNGPPTMSAEVGETLTLRARIYNYSLAEMPEGTKVHVAFYAQPWDPQRGFETQPGNPDAFAPAVYIGEAPPLVAIPAFCSELASNQSCELPEGGESRNWALAEVTWDTSTLDPLPAAETYWVFWVVTWMERDEQMVSEIAGHGLKAIPTANLNSLADVPIELYSNNLGYHNQAFALLAPGTDDLALGTASEVPKLRIEKLHVEPKRRQRDEPMRVQATLHSNQPVDDVMVNFYDGDPDDGGVLFDVEMIPRVVADQPFVVRVPYRRMDCTKRRIHLEAFSMSDPVEPAHAETRHRIRPDLGCRGTGGHGRHKHFAGRDHLDR